MLSYVWGIMILASVVTAFFTGRISDVTAAVMDGASDGVMLILSLTGITCFWTGLMEIAERSGLIQKIARLLHPVTRFLFPQLPPESAAMQAIVMNMSANLLGMSNAATPLGLSAMQELDKQNKGRKKASDAMCMFVIINTASIQIIPTTLILLRKNTGSSAPAAVLLPIWLVSVCAFMAGTLSAKLFQRRD